MSKRGQRKEESHEDEERWLITYADMITLLMAFFIMMYSMSVIDLKKFDALSDSAHGIFGGNKPVIASGANLFDGASSLVAGEGNQASLVNEIKQALKLHISERLRANVAITHTGGVVTISIKADKLTFPLGEARLTQEVREILDILAPPLEATATPLLIEGHTCDLPINTTTFASNWELSAQRATNVMVYLIRTGGIAPDHISAVGYADTRPLTPNDSEQKRIRNRRVNIIVLTRGPQSHRLSGADVADGEHVNQSRQLRRLELCPAIDLRTRYYEHTGRRNVDRPASDLRRDVSSCD